MGHEALLPTAQERFTGSVQDLAPIGKGRQLKLAADSVADRILLKVTDQGGLSDIVELEW